MLLGPWRNRDRVIVCGQIECGGSGKLLEERKVGGGWGEKVKEGDAMSDRGANSFRRRRRRRGLARQRPRGDAKTSQGLEGRSDAARVGVSRDWLFASVKFSSTLPPTHVVRTFAPRVPRTRTRTIPDSPRVASIPS